MNDNDNSSLGAEMVNPEHAKQPPLGERILRLLGFEHLIGTEMHYKKGGKQITFMAENFTDICGEEARSLFQTLETLDPNNPDHAKFFDAARAMVQARLEISTDQELGNS